jgi:hypothetical protein
LGFPSNTIDYIRRKIYVEKNPAKVKGYTKENMGKKKCKKYKRLCDVFNTWYLQNSYKTVEQGKRKCRMKGQGRKDKKERVSARWGVSI